MAERKDPTDGGRPAKGARAAKRASTGSPTEPSRSRRLLRVGIRWSVRLAAASLVVGAVGAGVGWWQYQEHVIRTPGPHLAEEHIRSIIAQESPVYYRDGTTRVGVFFEDEHRQYVPWHEIPAPFAFAIVAAEDGTFWAHHGVSLKHIARAMKQNLEAGDVVAGGSTLTQQTAKNLYYRPDRSWRSKGTELLNALRLEAHYDKTEILTFYANQFHVSGNGRGLGIAARYFFDRDVEELGLLECAFLAGLVKGPSNYDPFLGDTARRERSLTRAHDRTRYVLRRIVDEPAEHLAGPTPPPGDQAALETHRVRMAEVAEAKLEAQRLLDEGFELPFRKGTFRYDSNAVLDEVGRRLREAPFAEVLEAAGIADPATAGLVVVTTLDPAAQREAIYGLWHHLSEVGTMMEALGPEAYVREGRGPHFEPDRPVKTHEFRVAQVTQHLGDAGKKHLELDLGGQLCLVDRDGVARVAVASWRGQKKDRNAKAPSTYLDEFVAGLPPGAVVYASVRAVPEAGPPTCDLEVRPELQGATVVIEDGQVRAMVAGSDNRNFNRATALRQFGSTWKPIVYHAALELGWSPVDPLDNQRNVFPFSTTYYWPSPDHAPAPVVSMAWAGANSENLASIWLLYHLTDRLSSTQVAALAEAVGLARRPDESEPAYRARIQKEGILPTPRRVDEAFFLQARHEVHGRIEDSAHPEDALALSSLLYGWGFGAERDRAAKESASVRGWKLRGLDNAWLSLSEQVEPCAAQHRQLAKALAHRGLPTEEEIPDLTVLVDGDRVKVACGVIPAGFVKPDEELLAAILPPEPEEPAEGFPDVTTRGEGILGRLFGERTETEGEPALHGPAASSRPVLVGEEDVLVDDRLHVSTLRAIDSAMKRRRLARDAGGAEASGLYDPELLYWHQDFRVLLGMKYVTELARQYGVRTEIKEVLSMPLGASEITLEEATSVYQGLVTGLAWDFPGRAGSGGPLSLGRNVPSPPASTLLIAEIRDVDGNVLYRAEPQPRPVSSPEVGAMTADILRNVVVHGTGRRALDAVKEGGARVPLGGKTGTTNDFRNAAFVGYAPFADAARYSLQGGFAVGVYVGYDDNRSMDVGNIRLAGASGALPAWIDAVRGLQHHDLLGEPVGAPEAGEWSLYEPDALVRVAVDGNTGLPVVADPLADAMPASVLSRAEVVRDAEPQVAVRFERERRPVRVSPSTEDATTSAPGRRRPLWGGRRGDAEVEVPPEEVE